jgi:hypothetical protein
MKYNKNKFPSLARPQPSYQCQQHGKGLANMKDKFKKEKEKSE